MGQRVKFTAGQVTRSTTLPAAMMTWPTPHGLRRHVRQAGPSNFNRKLVYPRMSVA
jgi:hypothetical protein